VAALRDVTLSVPAGECLLITGPSGGGKSTLVRLVAGLVPKTIPATVQGMALVAGLNPVKQTEATISRHVGVVFQNPAAQLFHLRVADDVAFGPRNLGLDEVEVGRRVDWALDAVGAAPLRERRPEELSGGQKQLVVIAAALAMQPQILLLDEPTASLDVAGSGHVTAALAKLRQKLGMTMVIIEHRLAEMVRLADRALVLADGRIAACGRAAEVLEDRDLQRRYGLRRPVEESPASWTSLLEADGHSPAAGQALVELRGVTAGYNGSPALLELDLSFCRGEFVGLVGDNGAGKSTMALVLAGLLKPSKGKVVFEGRRRPRPGLDVSLLFQNPADQLFTDSIDEEVAFGPRNYRRFDRAFHEEILATTRLQERRQCRPLALSMGQQQRTAVGACLSLRPRLLILDEPTLGQDWGHLQRIMAFLLELNREGITILLITHDYKLVHRFARRVILLREGRIVLDGQIKNGVEE